ncbi:uncharacterized protein LACBIDRAFT_322456 [Laccaria bicolor S238N-H82]|uniref:Predicted protein n=1 Tax=Laccaria bicolor (strain S238N-H82 / ATCC MYA-4686) TaxID=486041 RepID=B0CWC7_LACBS|nr:uncharacterized protein LACBIDRAFT_322456 [Laccaria bicolor S238N-H82]EDR13045.1 predicted protein [Laccaria bicolor S238N-H82]|eukprot:XP_001875543.1 predicted protein [Laccaria bicolor S238N-H82]
MANVVKYLGTRVLKILGPSTQDLEPQVKDQHSRLLTGIKFAPPIPAPPESTGIGPESTGIHQNGTRIELESKIQHTFTPIHTSAYLLRSYQCQIYLESIPCDIGQQNIFSIHRVCKTNKHKELITLASTCKSVCVSALDMLWRDITTLRHFFLIIPGCTGCDQKLYLPSNPDWSKFNQVAGRVKTLNIRENFYSPNNAQSDLSAYKAFAKTFGGSPLLPQLHCLTYTTLSTEQDVSAELESLITGCLNKMEFKAEETLSDMILERLESTCTEIKVLRWNRPWCSPYLPHALSRLPSLGRLELIRIILGSESIGILSTLSSLSHLSIIFFTNKYQSIKSYKSTNQILPNLETLEIYRELGDVSHFISYLNVMCLISLGVTIPWVTPRGSYPWSSIGNAISSLKTLSLMACGSDDQDHVDIERLLEPFGSATTITKLSMRFICWMEGNTLDTHLSKLLTNYPLLESLEIMFQVEYSNYQDMVSLKVVCNAVKSCPKLRRIRFIGNINPTLLDGLVMDSFANLEELDLGKSRAMDEHGRQVELDREMLEIVVQRLVPVP